MNVLESLFSAWVILLYFKPFCQGGGKFEVITVEYIKEIPSDDQIPSLEEDPLANTEEKRLELCRRGLKQIQNFVQRLTGKDALSKGTEIGKLKFYVFQRDNFEARSLPAYKCPIEPDEIYIHVDSGNKDGNEPILKAILKKDTPRFASENIQYQLVRVENIVRVNSIDMMSMSKTRRGIPMLIPALDTDEFTDEQRLQICHKGTQTWPGLNIELSKDTKMSKNKFYKVKKIESSWEKDEDVMEAFECPEQPKIYISVERKKYPYHTATIYVLMKITDGERPTTNPRELRTISGKTITEDLYQQIKYANTNTRRDIFIDSKVQYEMCRAIFKERGYSDMIDLTNTQTYHELKKNHPNFWTRFYKEEDSELASGKDIIIVSGPESTDVMVSETRQDKPEDLHVCLIAPTPGSTVAGEEYFFSKEYNVNNAKDSSKNYIAGRFLFERDPNNNSVVVTSMMEEFVKPLETSNVELTYLERRKKEAAAKSNLDDTLCKLDSVGRSRVCKLVFNYSELPMYELGCALNPVTFVTNDGEKDANGNQYYEWMIPCYDFTERWEPSRTLYLSLVRDKSNPTSSNDLFVYSRVTHKAQIVLEKAVSDPRIGILLTEK